FSVILFLPLDLFSFNIEPHYMFVICSFIIILFIGIFSHKIYELYFTLNEIRINLLFTSVFFAIFFFISRNHIYGDLLNLKYYNRIDTYNKLLSESIEIQNIVGNQKHVY